MQSILLKFNTIMGVEKLVEINNMQMTSGFNLFTCDENYMSHESVKEKMDALYDKNPDIWNNSNNFGAIEQISTDPSVTTFNHAIWTHCF